MYREKPVYTCVVEMSRKDNFEVLAVVVIRIRLIFRKFATIRGIGTKLAQEAVWFGLISYQVTLSGSIF